MSGASATPNVFKQSYFASFIDVTGSGTLRGDVSMNSRLFVGNDVSMNGNLYVAKNLGIGINSTAFGPSGQIFALDVSGTTNFRGPVNPITLSDNSVLLTNTPSLDYANNFSTKMTVSNSGASYWNTIAMSANGQYQTVGRGSGNIYYSNDYGVNWTISTGSASTVWVGVAMSSNGQYQTAVTNNGSTGSIYNSTNYGVNWAQNTSASSAYNWQSISMSASGQYQSAVITGSTGVIWYSTNYGVTWTQSGSTNASWYSIAMSANGQYQSAAVSTGFIYYSTNYGITWIQSGSISSAWSSISMSASGQYQSAVINGTGMYYSTNYGVTWTQSASFQTYNWQSIDMSASGEYQVAVTLNASTSVTKYILYSTNYGVTWSQNNASASNTIYYKCIAISANGQYISAGAGQSPIGTGFIYNSITPYFNMAISGSTLASTSTSTGALTVGGGVGIGGNLYVGGRTIISGNVGIGTTNPVAILDVNATQSSLFNPFNSTNWSPPGAGVYILTWCYSGLGDANQICVALIYYTGGNGVVTILGNSPFARIAGIGNTVGGTASFTTNVVLSSANLPGAFNNNCYAYRFIKIS